MFLTLLTGHLQPNEIRLRPNEHVVLGPCRQPPPTNATPIALHVLPTSSHDRWKPWTVNIRGLPPLTKNNECYRKSLRITNTLYLETVVDSGMIHIIIICFSSNFQIGSTSCVPENLVCVLQITLRCFFSLEVCVVGILVGGLKLDYFQQVRG